MNDGRVRFCPRGCPGRGGAAGGNRGKSATGASGLRVESWNKGTLTRKSTELARILDKRKINIACVQETKWVETKARDVHMFKLWYSGGVMSKNMVGILVNRELRGASGRGSEGERHAVVY